MPIPYLTFQDIPDDYRNENTAGGDIAITSPSEMIPTGVPSNYSEANVADPTADPDFKHLTFLGASIRSFNGSVGWNESESTLTVDVVEDPDNASDGKGVGSTFWWLAADDAEQRASYDNIDQHFNGGDDIYHDGVADAFNPPAVGFPVFFKYGASFSTTTDAWASDDFWTFGGLLAAYTQSNSTAGKRLFNITVTDPRQILGGVQLVLNGFNGPVSSVPNLFNIFGFWEDEDNTQLPVLPTDLRPLRGFGGAEVNEGGMYWDKIRTGLFYLMSTEAVLPFVMEQYGGRVNFLGVDYRVNLENLPPLPLTYRIGGDSITLLEFISQVCDAANHDFFITLDPPPDVELPKPLTGGTIVVHTIDRRLPPTIGAITTYVTEQTAAGFNVASNNTGFELAAEKTSKFLVGGNEQACFFNFKEPLPTGDNASQIVSSGEFQEVWPYWGVDSSGNAIIGEGHGDRHRFTLDSRLVTAFGIGDTYDTNVKEMRYVLAGQPAWEQFLVQVDKIDAPTDEGSFNPQYQRATDLKLVGELKIEFADLKILNDLGVRTGLPNTKDLNRTNVLGEEENNTLEIYKWLRSIADEHLGKKFMVRIDDVQVSVDPDTERRSFSVEPSDEGGYIAEDERDDAADNNYIPSFIEALVNEQDLFQPYVRFDNAQELNLESISEGDMEANLLGGGITVPPNNKHTGELDTDNVPISYLDPIWLDGVQKYSVFIKCEIDPNIKFVDRSEEAIENGDSNPRVILTLPGDVKPLTNSFDKQMYSPLGFHAENLSSKFKNSPDPVAVHDGDDPTDVFYNNVTAFAHIAELVGDKIGSKDSKVSKYGSLVIPDMTMAPLKSNVLTYGPWFAGTTPGPLIFEQEDDLVPWNYGGFTLLNTVAQARVSEIANDVLLSEKGNLKVVGVPTIQLGEQLIDSGPYVTDLRVTINAGEATSEYTLQTWTADFGKLNRYEQERLAKASKDNLMLMKEFRLLEKKNFIASKIAGAKGQFTEEDKKETPRETSSTNLEYFFADNTASWLTNSEGNPRSKQTNAHSGVLSTCALAPRKDFLKQMVNKGGDSYQERSFMGMEGMFRPFSTNHFNPFESLASFVKPAFPYTNVRQYEGPRGVLDISSTEDGIPSSDAEERTVLASSGARTPEPTVFDLNPFADGHDVVMISRGAEVLEDGIDLDPIDTTQEYSTFASGDQLQLGLGDPGWQNPEAWTDATTGEEHDAFEGGDDPQYHDFDTQMSDHRGVGLRGPLIIGGWGYDTAGTPVPALGREGQALFDQHSDGEFDEVNNLPNTPDKGPLRGNLGGFTPEHKLQSHLWKTGPVDLRWNEKRGVWAGGQAIKEGFLVEDLTAPTGADPTADGIGIIFDSPDKIAVCGFSTARAVLCVGEGADFSPILVPGTASGVQIGEENDEGVFVGDDTAMAELQPDPDPFVASENLGYWYYTEPYTKKTVTIVNRDRNFTASSGEHIMFVDINDEYRPFAGGSTTTSTRQTINWEFTTYIANEAAWPVAEDPPVSADGTWDQVTGFQYVKDKSLLGTSSNDRIATDNNGERFTWTFPDGYSNFANFRKGKDTYVNAGDSKDIAATAFSQLHNITETNEGTYTGPAYLYNESDGINYSADIAFNGSRSTIPVWDEATSKNLTQIEIKDEDGNWVFNGTPNNQAHIKLQFINTICTVKDEPDAFTREDDVVAPGGSETVTYDDERKKLMMATAHCTFTSANTKLENININAKLIDFFEDGSLFHNTSTELNMYVAVRDANARINPKTGQVLHSADIIVSIDSVSGSSSPYEATLLEPVPASVAVGDTLTDDGLVVYTITAISGSVLTVTGASPGPEPTFATIQIQGDPTVTQTWKKMSPQIENNTVFGQSTIGIACRTKTSTFTGQSLLLKAEPGGTVTYDLFIRGYSIDALANASYFDIEFADLN